MGATVTTNKAVAGFHRADGTVVYVLFEETYEKNVHPHTPNWNARAIGTYDQVMLRVFQSAAACEGGSLQLRGGHTTPEAYIQRWREAFKSAVPMADRTIDLAFGGTSMYSTIPDEKVADARAKLEAVGRHDLIERLEAGPVRLQLHADCDVIVALSCVGGPLSLWKVIRGGPPHGFADVALTPAPRKETVKAPDIAAFLIDDENVVASIGGASFENLGWRYSAVGEYIVDVALPLELRCDGASRKLISAFRKLAYAAPKLPEQTQITIVPSNADHCYYRENAEKLAVKLGIAASAKEVPESYQVTFGRVQEAEEVYLLTTLQQAQVTWSIPAAGEEEAAAQPAFVAPTQFEQHALF